MDVKAVDIEYGSKSTADCPSCLPEASAYHVITTCDVRLTIPIV